jgi:hypothetical protein
VPPSAPYVPKHRAAVPAAPEPAPRRTLRRSLVLSGAAVAATGIAVSSGVADPGATSRGAAVAAAAPSVVVDPVVGSGEQSAAQRARTAGQVRQALADRGTAVVSRSDERSSVDPTKAKVLDQRSGGQVTQTEDLTSGDPRDIARAMLPQFGFGSDQFSCLDSLYNRESGWNVHADNPSSSAYGIPQALPGSKMSSAGSHWADDPATQIRWGLGYIKARYGTPCGAWGHSESHNWY